MKKLLLSSLTIVFLLSFMACNKKSGAGQNDDAQADSLNNKVGIQADVYEVGFEPLKITLVGHASLMFEYMGMVIHVDPYSQVADYTTLPKADFILLTHEHGDHLDVEAINAIKKPETQFILTKTCNEILGFGDVLRNGQHTERGSVYIQAVPAYNIVNRRPEGDVYHPKGRGNGYILSIRDKKIYIAGDTENIPEMNNLKGTIDIAFLPKNLPYTMSDEMFIDVAKKIMPKILYPYHMSEFNQDKIESALQGTGIELKVRPMANK
jgi:Predicted Zn-dependent hydrolases of the beta-lactamase fold